MTWKYETQDQEKERRGKWHKWFAWYPVVSEENYWVWMQTIWRKEYCLLDATFYSDSYWVSKYRLKAENEN